MSVFSGVSMLLTFYILLGYHVLDTVLPSVIMPNQGSDSSRNLAKTQ
jgi:hypothetical protein